MSISFAKKQKGFTLFEMVMVIVLIGILVAVSAPFVREVIRAQHHHQDNREAIQSGQLAMAKISKDIQDTRSTSASDLIMGANTITIVDSAGNTISYALNSSSIERNSKALADNVDSLSFSYFDLNGNTTAINSEARFVMVKFTTTVGDLSQEFRNTIYMPNSNPNS